ncbi:MAG: hypothetical protein HOM18_11460 [Candidatus Marinimicrobia bacterium]|jgi:hypothetical protein|nr:hypothetical protein [Candidatus Neomarinimicrobiota bacterium]
MIRERKRILLNELLDYFITSGNTDSDIDDWEVIQVYDSAGNTVPRCDSLEVVYEEQTIETQEDKDELTPDEQNDELRRLGF